MKKVLFVNPFGIGDTIFSFYVVSALKKARPEIRVDFLCNERTSELGRMNPDISLVHHFDRSYLRRIRSQSVLGFLGEYGRLVRNWRAHRYDALFDYSLGREFSFLGLLAGIRDRYGFNYKGRGSYLSRSIPLEGYETEPVAETQLKLLKLAGVEDASSIGGELHWRIPEADEKRAALLLNDVFLPEGQTGSSEWVALAPGGGQSWGPNAIFKQWEPEKFAETANAWYEKYGMGVILLGGDAEKSLLEKVRRKLRVPFVYACAESFGVVASLLRRSYLLLCNDGGLLHFAHSLGVRTVSLFGPVDEIVYGPFGNGVSKAVLTEPVECRPCYRGFQFPPCPYERRCLAELSVQKVLESMRQLA